jgi:hypothetical protein
MHWYMHKLYSYRYGGGRTSDMSTDIADIWVTHSDAWTDTHDALICQRNTCDTDILKQRRAPSTLKEVCRDRDKHYQALPNTHIEREGENWRGKRDEGEDKHRQSHFIEKMLNVFGIFWHNDIVWQHLLRSEAPGRSLCCCTSWILWLRSASFLRRKGPHLGRCPEHAKRKALRAQRN